MKVVLLLSIGMFGFGAVAESHAFGPQQATSRVEAKRQNKERQERKANLVAELKLGKSKFFAGLEYPGSGGDRGLSSLLRVAMEPDLKLIRAASVEFAKPYLFEDRAYIGLLVEILFEYRREELSRKRSGGEGFLYLDCINGRLSIRDGWGSSGVFADPIPYFDQAVKTRKRRNLDRFKGQISKP